MSQPAVSPSPASPSPSQPTAQQGYVCHVISNTHWDREWRYSFQSYRMDLVEMMDRLLDTLETVPEYRGFFLDSQTVILEDYLEVRPENEDRVRRLVQADRLQIGPWYTLPDEWGCPGESLVRNLLMGHRVAKRFGPVAKVGYTPFSNGQISQLPQLYRGFGIDSVFFYRGIGKHIAKSDFLWEGADGSQVYAFRFGDYARYNYYYLIYRPGLLGRKVTERAYEWNTAEIPFRVASHASHDRHYGWMAQQLEVHEDLLADAVEDARKFTAPDAQSRHLLYMMGHDHSFAAPEEVDLIRALQKHAETTGDQIIHSTLTDYMVQFRRDVGELQVVRGEMRHTLKEGLWTTLMALILSSRLYLKQRNAEICSLITAQAEPLAAMAWLTGSGYPERVLEIAWKKILVNHAHDAIGGCSMDKVHLEMMARWSEVEAIGEEIIRRSMRDIAGRIDGGGAQDGDMQLTVFNTLAHPRGGVHEFSVDLPHPASGEGLAVLDSSGRTVESQVMSNGPFEATIEGGFELTMPFPVRRHRLALNLPEIPAMGYEALTLRRTASEGDGAAATGTAIENELLRAEFAPNGTITLTDKRTGRTMERLFLLEDTAEMGDPWSRVVPEGDQPLLSDRASATEWRLHDGPLVQSARAKFSFEIPPGRGDDGLRAARRVALPVAVTAVLRKGSPRLEVTLSIDNVATDHRLRVLLPSGIAGATHSVADGQFDTLQRPIRLPGSDGWKEKPYPTHPMWSWVDVSDGASGFAVLQDGLIEYEVIDDEPRTLAMTLLRSYGKFVYGRPVPGAQCLGRHEYRFAVEPHAGDWQKAVLHGSAAEFLTAMPALQSAPTRGTLPRRSGFLEIDAPGTVLSGLKQAEDGHGLVVRFWNPLPGPVEARVICGVTPSQARRLTLEEVPEGPLDIDADGSVRVQADGKKIVTVGLRFPPVG